MKEYIEKESLIKWIERQKRLSKLLTIQTIQDEPPADVLPVCYHGKWLKNVSTTTNSQNARSVVRCLSLTKEENQVKNFLDYLRMHTGFARTAGHG